MRYWRSIQAEVLASLAIVLLTSTILLTTLLLHTKASQIDALRPLIGRSLLAEANSPMLSIVGGRGPADWWLVDSAGARTLGPNAFSLDPEDLALSERARSQGEALFQVGHPWEPIRFATPMTSSDAVAIARIAPVVPGSILLGLLVTDAVVFVLLGSYLLRRRVVLPLSRLATSARAIGEGARSIPVHVEGEGEVAEVARAFNEMTSALELRSDELEKAVTDLRGSNESLLRSRSPAQ
jgi:HAMP domain-containing protein